MLGIFFTLSEGVLPGLEKLDSWKRFSFPNGLRLPLSSGTAAKNPINPFTVF